MSSGTDVARLSNGYHPNLVVSPDGRQIAWSPFSPLVYLEDFGALSRLSMSTPPRLARFFSRWRWSSARLREPLGPVSQVDRLAFSPDGTRLATISRDGSAKVWDARSGREVLTLDRNDSRSDVLLVEAPDNGETVRSWRESVRLSFSGDGRRLVLVTRSMTVDHYEQTEIRTWNVGPGRHMPNADLSSQTTYRRCAAESSLHSSDSEQPVTLTFINHGETLVARYWIDYAGQRNFYGWIAPHHKAVDVTFAGHVWVITDPHDNCIATTVAGQQSASVHF